MRELLTLYKYDGEKTPFVRGSALCALEGKNDELGKNAIKKVNPRHARQMTFVVVVVVVVVAFLSAMLFAVAVPCAFFGLCPPLSQRASHESFFFLISTPDCTRPPGTHLTFACTHLTFAIFFLHFAFLRMRACACMRAYVRACMHDS